jgi:four helix bundle suffix protein
MPAPGNIQLQYYADGTPSVLRRPVVYQELYFYKRSDILYQLTVAFCRRFLPKHGDRTVDQMVQAARSTMQNIAEGSSDGASSAEVEIKLLGIARGSNQELLGDYQNHLKTHNLQTWWGQNPRADKLHAFCTTHMEATDFAPYFERWTEEEMANCAICLCHMVDKGLCSYIAKRDREFVEQGGIRERMTAARLGYRTNQNDEIARLQAENTRLQSDLQTAQAQLRATQAEVARLQAILSSRS